MVCATHNYRCEKSKVSSRMDFDVDPPVKVSVVEQFLLFCPRCGHSFTVDRTQAEFESFCRINEDEAE